jgi:hypothetical protein
MKPISQTGVRLGRSCVEVAVVCGLDFYVGLSYHIRGPGTVASKERREEEK